MQNINLNLGGLLGALACGVLAGVIVFSAFDISSADRWPYKVIIGGVIAGAFAGNAVWALVFRR